MRKSSQAVTLTALAVAATLSAGCYSQRRDKEKDEQGYRGGGTGAAFIRGGGVGRSGGAVSSGTARGGFGGFHGFGGFGG